MKPLFPLHVVYPRIEENVPDTFETPEDLALHLEFFESDRDGIVYDKLGRKVDVVIERLEIIKLELSN